jgi:hypothetical protein
VHAWLGLVDEGSRVVLAWDRKAIGHERQPQIWTRYRRTMMNKHATALAGLITAASIATGTAITAQAHPSHLQMQMNAHHTSKVAVTRLHALMQMSRPEAGQRINLDDQGAYTH